MAPEPPMTMRFDELEKKLDKINKLSVGCVNLKFRVDKAVFQSEEAVEANKYELEKQCKRHFKEQVATFLNSPDHSTLKELLQQLRMQYLPQDISMIANVDVKICFHTQSLWMNSNLDTDMLQGVLCGSPARETLHNLLGPFGLRAITEMSAYLSAMWDNICMTVVNGWEFCVGEGTILNAAMPYLPGDITRDLPYDDNFIQRTDKALEDSRVAFVSSLHSAKEAMHQRVLKSVEEELKRSPDSREDITFGEIYMRNLQEARKDLAIGSVHRAEQVLENASAMAESEIESASNIQRRQQNRIAKSSPLSTDPPSSTESPNSD